MKTNSFAITLGTTYYTKGCINPGTEADKHIGAHDEHVCIHLGARSENPVQSTISRTANPNGTARIQSRAAVRDWFQEHFKLGDVVEANIIDRNNIILMKP